MKRSLLITAIALTAGAIAGFTAARLLHAQRQPVQRTSLLETELEGIPGKEADVFLIELAPQAATGRHSHPGSEIAYILEGSASVETEKNKKPMTSGRGSIVYLTPNLVHDVKNPSKTAPLKAIVFALYDKGKPRIVPAK